MKQVEEMDAVDIIASSKEWRCFHCDDLFTDKQAAADHFGTDWYCEMEAPACIQILTEGEKAIVNERRESLRLLRAAEGELEQSEHLATQYKWQIHSRWKVWTVLDVWYQYEEVEGRMLAAEEALKAAPRWLASFLRRRAERLWHRREKAKARMRTI